MSAFEPYIGMRLRHKLSGAVLRVIEVAEDFILVENNASLQKWVWSKDFGDFEPTDQEL